MSKSYVAKGQVVGNCWGGGRIGFKSETVYGKSKEEVEKKIFAGIEDGSLDSGMGYEQVTGAVMKIICVESREVNGKIFKRENEEINIYGDVTEAEIELLMLEIEIFDK
jgi:hypothetical protein